MMKLTNQTKDEEVDLQPRLTYYKTDSTVFMEFLPTLSGLIAQRTSSLWVWKSNETNRTIFTKSFSLKQNTMKIVY
ncbi:unnamed protein product [Tenebrio molitor]|nr:unnamed protein product [Tenebrio molitor]